MPSIKNKTFAVIVIFLTMFGVLMVSFEIRKAMNPDAGGKIIQNYGSKPPLGLPKNLPLDPKPIEVLESTSITPGHPFSRDLLVGYRYVTNTDKSREELLKEFEEYATNQGFQIYNRSSYGALAFSSRRDGGEELTVRVGRTTEEGQALVSVRYTRQ